MPSVPDVSGSARTMKSLRLISSGSCSGRQDLDVAAQAVRARRADGASRSRASRMSGQAPRRAGRSNPDRRRRPSRRAISRPSSGCHVRSRCSSSSCGSRRLMARIIISTYSAIGSLNTPRALVMAMPRSRAAGVSTRSTPAVAEWTHISCGQRLSSRSKMTCGIGPRSSTSTSRQVAVGEAFERDRDDARAGRGVGDAREVLRLVARGQDRRQPDRGRHAGRAAARSARPRGHHRRAHVAAQLSDVATRGRAVMRSCLQLAELRQDAFHPRCGSAISASLGSASRPAPQCVDRRLAAGRRNA